MAVIATVVTVDIAYKAIRSQFNSTREYLDGKRALFVQPTCSAFEVVALVEHLARVVPILNIYAATPGIAAYAAQVEGVPTYNVVAEYQSTKTALIALRDNLTSSFPVNAGGFLLYEKFAADGTRTYRQFTSTDLLSAVGAIDAALATFS